MGVVILLLNLILILSYADCRLLIRIWGSHIVIGSTRSSDVIQLRGAARFQSVLSEISFHLYAEEIILV